MHPQDDGPELFRGQELLVLGMEGRAAHGALGHARGGRACGSPLSVCAARSALWRGGFFAPAAGDLSGFVYEEVSGAEPYEASYGIDF